MAEYGGTAYPSLDALLADPQVDAVVNLSIHHAHPAVITQCLEAGKHVLVEKPLARSADEGRAMIAAARERERILMIAFNHRYRGDV
ncbi:hypothetical protein SE17_43500, partial [Kouleothrix aurantiaca]